MWNSKLDGKKGTFATGVPGQVNSYQDDVSSEGRQPDNTVEIAFLDEKKMLDAWITLKQGGRYQVIYKNCATSVSALLRAGGANLSFNCQLIYEHTSVWEPSDVISYGETINANASTIKERIAAGFTPEPVNTWVRSFMEWAWDSDPDT